MDANQPLESAPLVNSATNPLTIEGLTANTVTFTGGAAGDSLYLRVNADRLEYSTDNTNYSSVDAIFTFSSQTQINVNLLAGDDSLFLDASLIQILQTTGGQLSFAGGADADTIFGPGGVNVNWNITGTNAGNITDIFEFTETENITGRGNDTLTGLNQANLWTITGNGTGTLNDQISFNDIDNLIGGSLQDTFAINGATTVNINAGAGADIFELSNGSTLSGTIDGGTGIDTLNYSADTTAQQVTLTGLGSSDGFAGTSNLTQQFTNIDNVIGGSGNNTLTGLNASATWEIDGTNRYISTNNLSFTGFSNLTGGSNADTFIITGNQTADLRGQAGADRFQFNNAANLTGTIDGGTDSDTIDASAYTTAQQVNLTGLGSSDGFAGTSNLTQQFTNIDNVIGG
ncbi:hypothetical protein, partial [Trichormus variabilis]|nr:hypothetical protein [Trichormus variabilis 9RC]